jgi:site-specific DNA recombinase
MWAVAVVRSILTNPVYKGDFYAHRMEESKVQKPTKDGLSTRTVLVRTERPPDEWIHVPVPPIVSRDVWESGNHMLEQNRKMARRNAREPYLLTGLIRCAFCGAGITGKTQYERQRGGSVRRFYRCGHRDTALQQARALKSCNNRSISCSSVDGAVWSAICTMLLEPDVLVSALESLMFGEHSAQIEQQIGYLQREIDSKQVEDERLYRAYLSGAFDEQEFAVRRQAMKAEVSNLTDALDRLQGQIVSQQEFEARRNALLSIAEQVRAANVILEPPFELKQRIIKQLVDKIRLNAQERWFTMEGKIRGAYSIEIIPVHRDFA